MASVVEGVLIASGARTGAATGDPAGTSFAVLMASAVTALEILIDTTVFSAGSVTVSLEGFDEGAGAFKPLLTSAAIVATGNVIIRYGPGFPVTANLSANGIVPRRWRVTTTGNGSSQTYSVAARALVE